MTQRETFERTVTQQCMLANLAGSFAGLAVGIPAALAVSRTLRSMLYGLSAGDPAMLLPALAGIGTVAVAALIPARRAASTDPMRALRME